MIKYTDENRSKRRKKRKSPDRFWRSKTEEIDIFMFESDGFLKTGLVKNKGYMTKYPMPKYPMCQNTQCHYTQFIPFDLFVQ